MKLWKLAFLAVCGLWPLLLAGCNAGTAGVLLALFLDDDDGDGDRKGQPTVLPDLEYRGVENARTRPAEAVILLRVSHETSKSTELFVEASVDGTTFLPASLVPPLPGTLEAPGKLLALATTPTGVIHRIGWNAVTDAGGSALKRMTLRFTTPKGDPVKAEVTIGNDPPALSEFQAPQGQDGFVDVSLVLADSSADPVDLAVEYARAIESEDPVFALASTEGTTSDLEASVEGVRHAFRWNALADLGARDTRVVLRVTPADRVQGFPGAVGVPAEILLVLELNGPPEVEILDESFLLGSDRRGAIAIEALVKDAEGDPVDVILQWRDDAGSYPEIVAEVDADAALRAAIFESQSERARLHVPTLRERDLEGTVERPAAGTEIAADQVLAAWLKSTIALEGLAFREALGGRPVEVLDADGDIVASSEVCAYDPSTGLLTIDPPFASAVAPGSRLRIRLGGTLATTALRSSAEGVLHRWIWDTSAEAPGGGDFRLRATPFDRVVEAQAKACRLPPEGGSGGMSPGARGLARETRGAKRIVGPFLDEAPDSVPLAPLDLPTALAAGDLDGDGRTDLVCAARISNTVVLLLQRTWGAFDEVRLSDARLREPTALVVADLDDDVDLDIAVAGGESGNLIVYFQGPDLDFFTDRVVLTAGDALRYPVGLSAIDLDGDGDRDLVVADAENSAKPVQVFFRGSAFGGAITDFSEGPYSVFAMPSLGEGNVYAALTATQLYAGSHAEIIAAGKGRLTVYSFPPADNQPGGRVTPRPWTLLLPGDEPRAVVSGDFDGDGLRDMALSEAVEGELILLRQEDTDDFVPTPFASPDLRGPVALAVADLDRNGRADLAIADVGDPGSLFGAGLRVLLSNGSGSPSLSALTRTPSDPGRVQPVPRAVVVVDLDGDGTDEIVTADEGSQDLAVYHQGGAGRFRSPVEALAGGQSVPEPSSLTAADLDADGRVDLLAPNKKAADLTWMRQTASGEATAFRLDLASLGTVKSPMAAEAADIDGDGTSDLVTADSDANAVWVLLQDPESGAFARAVLPQADGFAGPRDVAARDVDGDGRIDIIAAGRLSHDVRWFRQGADGSFALQARLAAPAGDESRLRGPVALGASDLDRDGSIDIVTANEVSFNTSVFFQSGAGVFGAPVEIAIGSGSRPVALAIADLDRNGLEDIVTANAGATRVAILRQTAPRAFSRGNLSTPQGDSAPTGVAVADFNGDARTDIALALSGFYGSSLRVHFQSAGGTFEDGGPMIRIESPVLAGPVGLVAVDFDGDGSPDLATANRLSRNLTVFFGGR